MDIIQILTPVILGVVVGLFLAYLRHLWVKYKDKKNMIKNINKQLIQNFIIPQKDNKGNYYGKPVKLKDLIPEENKWESPKDDTSEPNKDYNDYTKTSDDGQK